MAVVREAKSGRTDHGFVFIALAVNSAAKADGHGEQLCGDPDPSVACAALRWISGTEWRHHSHPISQESGWTFLLKACKPQFLFLGNTSRVVIHFQ